MRSGRLRWMFVVGVLSAWLVTCAEPTEMVVVVTTDIPCASVTETTIAVGPVGMPDDRAAASTSKTCDANGKVGTAVLVPSGDKTSEVSIRVVLGANQPADACIKSNYKGGCVVSRRALRYVRGRSLQVPIKLEDACRDKECTPTTTCIGGQCVPSVADCSSGTCTLTPPTDGGPPGPGTWRPMASAPDCGSVYTSNFPSYGWTGTELVVWGGGTGLGGAYDPAKNTWRCITGAPIQARRGPLTVWMPTVKKVFVWGGETVANDIDVLALWDPAAGWSTGQSAPALMTGRRASAGVWSPATNEVIVWGGSVPNGSETNRGAAYNPATNTWRMISLGAPTTQPYYGTELVAIGGKVIRFGGIHFTNSDNASYAIYDPKTDTWSTVETTTALGMRWTVSEAATLDSASFWGGRSPQDVPSAEGLLVDATGKLTSIAPPGTTVTANPARWGAASWFANGRLYFFGGSTKAPNGVDDALADGMSYEVASQTWAKLPTAGAPSARTTAVAVWTGKEAIVWSGEDATGKILTDGAIFTP